MKQRNNFNLCLRLLKLSKPLGGYMLLAVVLGLVGHLCATFIPVLGGMALLHQLDFNIPYSLTTILSCALTFAFLRGLFRYGEQYCNHFIAFKLLALIRDRVFSALRRLAPAKLEGRDKGNLITLITSDIELLEVFYAHTISPVVIATLMSSIVCLLIATFHPLLGAIALMAYLTIGLFIPLKVSTHSAGQGAKFRSQSGALGTFILESLRGLGEVIQYDPSGSRLDMLEQQSDALSKQELIIKSHAGNNTAITGGVILGFNSFMLLTATMLSLRGELDFVGVLVPFLLLASSYGPVAALADLGSGLQNTFAAGQRVLDLLDETPVTAEVSGYSPCRFSGTSMDSATFSYEKETILSDVSFQVKPGEIVGIIGRSGSGKSTLLRLLMRFWSVDEGNVRLSNRDIEKINTTDLRNMEAYVTQETHLFSDSIAANLRIAKHNATQRELETACRKASIHKFITTLPQGYDTPLGELGDRLSGGERQRIGLARAFLHGAPLLLFDEPTSNLDSLNEAIILNSIISQRGLQTVILVSHRPSTLDIADRTYSVENGRIS